MCRENSLKQINAALSELKNAKTMSVLYHCQIQVLAFIKAAEEAEEIKKIEANKLAKKARKIYRNQLIEESA